MNCKNILLAFDGSLQSLNAAELCWSLASRYPVKLTAQHVVNTTGLWQLLNFELPGLTGSGPYIEAHQAMCQELRAIGETLATIYEAKAHAHGITDTCILDEGEAVSEVLRRSLVHDLVVIGHHGRGRVETESQKSDEGTISPSGVHFSMAESLAKLSEKPILVVQDSAVAWQKLKLILHGDRGVAESFRAAADLCAFFAIQLEVNNYFTASEDVGSLYPLGPLVDETKKRYPNLSVTIKKAKLWPDEFGKRRAKVECEDGTLAMIPTLPGADGRLSLFGTPAELFVRYGDVQSLLLWPAEAENPDLPLRKNIAELNHSPV